MNKSLRKVKPKNANSLYLPNHWKFMKRFFFFAFLVIGLGACHSSQVVTGIGFKDYTVKRQHCNVDVKKLPRQC
jgi:hypothetical protein